MLSLAKPELPDLRLISKTFLMKSDLTDNETAFSPFAPVQDETKKTSKPQNEHLKRDF